MLQKLTGPTHAELMVVRAGAPNFDVLVSETPP